MIDPLDFENRPLLSLLSRKRRLTALVLFLENGSQSLWRILAWIALLAGLSLMQLPAIFGTTGVALFFVLFFGGGIYFLRKDLSGFTWPESNDIDRALERTSHIKHRPISAIDDDLVNPRKPETRGLWQKNQDEALSEINNLRIPFPRALLSQNDPLGLRTLAALVLIIGIVAAGPAWQKRLTYSLFPFSVDQTEAQKGNNITLWITPPDYTALPQITLQEGKTRTDTPLKVPAGTLLTININEGFFSPTLIMGETGRELKVPLKKRGEKSWGLETKITSGKRIILKQGLFTKADIDIDFIIDQPPLLTINGAPEALPKGETRLPLKLLDDYGVTDIVLHMVLDPVLKESPLGRAFEETRAIMSPPGTELEMSPVYDLSWHPWAGLPVIIKVTALDHLGQKSTVIPLYMTLPERPFSHKIAKQLITLRKRLIWTPELAARNVSYDLEALLEDPSQFQNNITVFLAIRSAASRLSYTPDTVALSSVIELLWDTALRIEEGNLPLSARRLENAQRALEQALKNPEATDEEIEKALQNMQEAMVSYFQDLVRELQKRMTENGEQKKLQPEMFQNIIPLENLTEDMTRFLAQLQAEILSGNRDSARELLSQLQQFTDRLTPSMGMDMPPQMKFMMEGINELQELIEKQKTLLDQTEKQARNIIITPTYPEFMPFETKRLEKWGMGAMPPPPQNPSQKETGKQKIDTRKNKVEQDALRYILGQLMLDADEKLGEIPENMQRAEQEMRSSAARLAENKPALSLPHQKQAIVYLQDSMQDMSKQIQKMMQQMMMLSFGGTGRLDPLGRPMQEGAKGSGLFPESRVKIPDKAERKRAQKILKILRQRAGERNRPNYELDYYRRLMKQF